MNVFLIGDSTVATCPAHEYPMAGWGQYFQQFFKTKHVTVINKAKGGASSNTFIEEGRLTPILTELKADDLVLIQFGHNDQKPYGTITAGAYKACLSSYIDQIEARGSQVALVSPVHRRFFKENGQLKNTLGEFPEVVKQLATERNVPLIDLSLLTEQLYQQLGVEGSKQLFTWLEPHEHNNYPDGVQDNTHFSENGAKRVGQLVCEQIKRLNIMPLVYFQQGLR
ncbi:Lysophospholipase L1 [Amphibacillus marinus]|uniref:Lysophospholipase L1 n=1 Tax=Amphibacillus marinus TaxID=872970 RepID=A0A1H8H588_9BACI|nr:rhamnogalacturonan acetylesterase [Amphibacillus marinus]SEN51406.1 Lysophospholipase L1 [Amphibacillus marinus]